MTSFSMPDPKEAACLPKTLALLIVVAVLGIAAIGLVTAGFRAISSEDVRRLAVLESPRTLPPVRLALADGGTPSLTQMLAADGRAVIVTFIYTNCNSICTVLGDEFQQLQRTIHARGLEREVRLVSISFDPADSPAHLRQYAAAQGADETLWQFAGVPDPLQRKALLQAFGVVVVPAPLGQFQHNAAFHVVSPQGKLIHIIDFDAPEAALSAALRSRRDRPSAKS